MVEVYDPLCVMIILEKKKLTYVFTERIIPIEENLEENQDTHKCYVDNP